MALGHRRDPRQARFLTWASLRWIVRNRAWNWWYLVRYWRFFWWRLRNRHIITEGFVFLGRRVQVHARRGYAQMVIGRWVHIGDENRIRAHEGTMRIGDKCVFGRDNTINGYLDIEFGEGCIVADWVYVCDFDHIYDDITYPIKDQGLVKTPVRIGPDCWLGAKVTVLRGTLIGHGCVLGAHAVVRGTIPPESVVVGAPARVVKNRREIYQAQSQRRAALADIQRKTAAAARSNASAGSTRTHPPAKGGSTSTDAPSGTKAEESTTTAPSTSTEQRESTSLQRAGSGAVAATSANTDPRAPGED